MSDYCIVYFLVDEKNGMVKTPWLRSTDKRIVSTSERNVKIFFFKLKAYTSDWDILSRKKNTIM